MKRGKIKYYFKYLILMAFILILILISFFILQKFNKLTVLGNIAKSHELINEKKLSFQECNSSNLINPETIIPRPQSVEALSCNTVIVDSKWKIFAELSGDDNFTSNYLRDKIFEMSNNTINIEINSIKNITNYKRIIIGNPNEDKEIMRITKANNINFSREISKGFNQGYILLINPEEILILGNSTKGTFYGIISLIWLLNFSGNSVSLPNTKIVDWPDFELRGYYGYGKGNYYNSDEEWFDNLAKYKYNFWNIGLYPLSDINQEEINKLLDREKFIRQRHFFTSITISPIWMPYSNPNLYEGLFVQNISYKFYNSDIASLSEDESTSVNNPGFETDSDNDHVPDYWTIDNNIKSDWSLDCSQSHSGKCSEKLNISQSLSPLEKSAYLITQNSYDLKPDRIYKISIWVKQKQINLETYGKLIVTIYNETGSNISSFSISFRKSGNFWEEYLDYIPTFRNESKLSLEFMATGPDSLELWIDDINISEINNKMLNVIETNQTFIQVWNENRTFRYRKDIDYNVLNIGNINYLSPDNGKKSFISRIDGGKIPNNSKISVDYDFLPTLVNLYYREFNADVRESLSFAEPLLFEEYRKRFLDTSLPYVKPDFIFLAMDEMRGFNRDSRSKKFNMTNYQLLAFFLNNISSLINSYSPNSKIMIFDDMISPFHNGKSENYQLIFGGVKGETWPALDLLDRDKFILISWWYYNEDPTMKMKISPPLYKKYGFKSIGGPWDRRANIMSWSYLSYKYNSLGIIEHGMYYPYAVPISANYSWNAVKDYENKCNKDSLEICDGIDNDCDDKYEKFDYDCIDACDRGEGYSIFTGKSNIDESFNLSTDIFNCGSCGNICYYPNGFGSCFNGKCKFIGCYSGYYDKNYILNDGCECKRTDKGTEICYNIDNTSQYIPLINNPPNEFVFRNKRISINITTGEKVRYIKYNINGNTYTILCEKCNHIEKYITLSDGSYTLNVATINEDNNQFNNSIKFSVDSNPPKIFSFFPKSNSFTNGKKFSVEYSEDNLRTIELFYGGEKYIKTNCPSGKKKVCAFDLNLSNFNNKYLSYYFTITDMANNTIKSESRRIKVDTLPPFINNPNSFWKLKREYVYFNIKITEENFLGVKYTENLSYKPKWILLCSSLNKNRECRSKKYFKSGRHNLIIRISDKSGNFIERTLSFYVS